MAITLPKMCTSHLQIIRWMIQVRLKEQR
uniref:Uncharacterized protein n=1 Tax=Arundo donax TaxID=35708 RepID=A0A0A9HIW1_ARUDO